MKKMDRFSLQNVKDQEVNRVLRQVQDSLNKLADAQTKNEPLAKKQTQVSSALNTLSSRVAESIQTHLASEATGVSFEFTQPTASSLWGITHNMGYFPSVTVVDSAGSVVIGDVKYLDINSLIINFSAPFSGTAYLS